MPDKHPRHIHLIEDDHTLNRLLCEQLRGLGYDVDGFHSLAEARIGAAQRLPQLMLVDMNLPDGDGFAVIEALAPKCPVIFLTAFGSVDQAVRAVHAGAADYLVKPVSSQTLDLALRKAFATVEMERDLRFWQDVARRSSKTTIVGDSPETAEMRDLIALYAAASSPVLIRGEGGTGKEMIARLIHDSGARAGGRFLALECEAPDERLAESELFGQEKEGPDGLPRAGMLEMASGGTIYLNDIADLSPRLQGRLLRVMESGTFRRMGGAQDIETDLRIIAGTRRDLGARVEDGDFRSELYYRLSAFQITVPALRDRRADIAVLARHFLAERSFQKDRNKQLSPAAVRALMTWDWPGNVRELRNVIERGVIMAGADSDVIGPEHLALPTTPGQGGPRKAITLSYEMPPSLETLRDDYLRLLLDRYDGNRSRVAETMGISERNTYRLIRKL